jgi:hypothetical protein
MVALAGVPGGRGATHSRLASGAGKRHTMDVIVFMNEAGMVWVENSQGNILAECFFKTDDETEDELQHMGYQRLLTVYPTAHVAMDTGMGPDDMCELFLEL